MTSGPTFLGYPRADGRVGVRNHVLVVPTVICSAVVAERIAASIAPIGAALPHLAGCGQLGPETHRLSCWLQAAHLPPAVLRGMLPGTRRGRLLAPCRRSTRSPP